MQKFSLVALLLLFPLLGKTEPIILRPDAPKISEQLVPPLNEIVPESKLPEEGLSILPSTGRYDWSRTAAESASFAMILETDSTRYDRATLTIWDWENRPIFQKSYSAASSHNLDIQITGRGSYLLTLDGYVGDICEKRFIRNIAVTTDMSERRSEWKTDEFYLGICAFPGRYHWRPGGLATLPDGLTEDEARNREAELMARLGLQVVRPDESIEMGTKRDGNYRFDYSRMDAAVEAYTSRGFEIALQTMNSPDWAVLPKYAEQGSRSWMYPHQEEPQRAYVSALVRRYGRHARFVQIGNEPDQIGYWAGTNEEFVHQFRFSHDQVRRDAPEIPITYGGFSLVDVPKCQFILDEIHDLVDLPAYNAHGALWNYKESFATMREIQRKAGDDAERWANTETGYSSWRLDQELRHGQIDAQKALYSWAHDHSGILLFCSRMTRGPGRDGTPDFGLIDYQFSPRFVYGSIAALTSTLVGASFEEILAEGEDVHLYSFRRGEDLIVAGFSLADGAAVEVESDARESIEVDAMGNRSPASDGVMTLDGYPRYRVLRGASFVRIK